MKIVPLLAGVLAIFAVLGSASAESFIRVENGNFYDGCDEFLVSGWNQWEVIEAAAGAPELISATLPPGKTGPEMIRDMLDRGKASGFNVMRAWAHSVSPDYALQQSPGVYNEALFRGLDYALDEARKRGIRVILSFTDNWPPMGGADEYVDWSPTANNHQDFFSDASTKQFYKNHVETVVNRVNSINGRTYKEDPTIMAWNLINEPRCVGCPGELQAWIDEMAPFVKSLDSNHLVSVGTEGFYSTSGKNSANPQGAGRWADNEGQDYINNHKSPSIDFMSFHSWVDNWQAVSEEFQRAWIRNHVKDAKSLGKPALLQEFGKIVRPGGETMEARNQYFRIVYDEVKKEMAEGTLKGAMFWQWYDEGQVAPQEEGGGTGWYDSGLYGIYQTDATFDEIKAFSAFVTSMGVNSAADGCVSKGLTVPPPTTCSEPGFEGPDCSIDINECVRGAGCHKNAGCLNLKGGFECECFYGYEGDGVKSCEPNLDLLKLNKTYTTEGAGRLACDEGEQVKYPVGAPGFVYDPTGSVDRNKFTKGQVGSRADTTVRDCEIACEMAKECTSFAYNPTLKQCFLKRCEDPDTCKVEELICTSKRTKQSFSCGIWQTYYNGKVAQNGRTCLSKNKARKNVTVDGSSD